MQEIFKKSLTDRTKAQKPRGAMKYRFADRCGIRESANKVNRVNSIEKALSVSLRLPPSRYGSVTLAF